MLTIKCISCQGYLPILTKQIRGSKFYSYAYCVNCGIKIDGIQKGSESLQACGEDIDSSKMNKEELKWLKEKVNKLKEKVNK